MSPHSAHSTSTNKTALKTPKLLSKQLLLKGLSLLLVAVITGDIFSAPTSSWLVSADESFAITISDDNDSDGKVCENFGTCLPWRSPRQHEPPISRSQQCGVWLAPSTIPGAGLGVFAGKEYALGDAIGASGDIVIPLVDLDIHQPGRKSGVWSNLWDDYVWRSEHLQMIEEGFLEVNSVSPGISATINCFMDLSNVVDWQPSYTMILDGRHDPGAGAITTYDTRWTTALRNIQTGEEFFITYGNAWFYQRPHLGPIPVAGDLKIATAMFRRYQQLMANYTAPTSTNSYSKVPSSKLWKDLWRTFVTQNVWKSRSRTLGSFNASNADEELLELQQKYNGSLFQLRRSQATRNQSWLEQHGVCVDHLREGPSKLPHAGRGAFSTRFLPNGTIVAPLPMIHITNDRYFNMYALTTDDKGRKVIELPKRVVGKQLLLNYCYGHPNSTMLLCPYGSDVNLVNHNQTLANVRLQWADPAKSNLNVSLLKQSVEYINAMPRRAVLSMELVAMRDIAEGEEIFLDYGDAWEAAWQQHLQSWQPPVYSLAAAHLNMDKTHRIRTVFEQIQHPYPPNVELKCDQTFQEQNRLEWEPLWKEPNSSYTLDLYRRWNSDMLASCDVLRWRYDGRRYLYTALFNRSYVGGVQETYDRMIDVPREAFVFVNRPYTSYMFASNAFRHAIMILDELFPETWKNRNSSVAEEI